jgi:hypothetical protein
MARNQRQGICGLCGAVSAVTKEHFVMRGLWPGPRPHFTETICACSDCNAGTSGDDEYSRNMLAMMCDIDHSQKWEVFNGPVKRSLQRDPAFVRHLLENVKTRSVRSPAGLWVADYPTVPLDVERLNRSLRKIVKGLYCRVRNNPFPAAGRIIIIGQMNARTSAIMEAIEEYAHPPTFDYGDDVFEWKFGQNREGLTLWRMNFYRSVSYFACGFDDGSDVPADFLSLEGGNASGRACAFVSPEVVVALRGLLDERPKA